MIKSVLSLTNPTTRSRQLWLKALVFSVSAFMLTAYIFWQPSEPLPYKQLQKLTAQSQITAFDKKAIQKNTFSPSPSPTESSSVSLSSSSLQTLSASSLDGTEVDGKLLADDSGNLQINVSVRRTFEYFLSVLGEAPLEAIYQDFSLYAQQQLPEPAASEAVELFYDYLNMKAELTDAMAASSLDQRQATDPDSLAQIYSLRQQIRSTHLGAATARAFFATEDNYDQYQLEKMRILINNELDAATQQQKLIDLEQQLLPTELAASIDRERKMTALAQEISRLKAAGASEAELYTAWADALGDSFAASKQLLEAKLRSP